MKKSLLETLKGMSVSKARQVAEASGHLVMEVPEGVVLAAVAFPNTVVLWMRDDGTVGDVTAGDPLELK